METTRISSGFGANPGFPLPHPHGEGLIRIGDVSSLERLALEAFARLDKPHPFTSAIDALRLAGHIPTRNG